MHPTYFVSDLHLLSSRSDARLYFDQLHAAASAASHFVLGGDIFDFRWARAQTLGEAVELAVGWLRRVAETAPNCQFHYVLGNHDHHEAFVQELGALAEATPNLTWHEFYFRDGVNVFLHGDVADRKMTAAHLHHRRSDRGQHKPMRPVRHHLYNLAVHARLHKPIPFLTRPKRLVARRILHYLRDVGHCPLSGVEHVYFGHIHRVVSHYRYGGLLFHSGGAPIRGLRFRIVKVEA